MNQRIEERIRRTFEDEYRAPTRDLRQGLRQPVRSRRSMATTLARVGALVMVGAIVALALSLPRIMTQQPSPTSRFRTSSTLTSYGFVVAATAEDLSGKGGRRELGLIPAGHQAELTTKATCVGRRVDPVHFTPTGKETVHDLLLGVFSADGRVESFSTAPRNSHYCRDGVTDSLRGLDSVTTSGATESRPEPVFVVAAPGVAWRVVLAVSRSTSPPAELPAELGSCSSSGLEWALSSTKSGAAVKIRLTPIGSAPECQLSIPVRMELYVGGTEKPLHVFGNHRVTTLTGSYTGLLSDSGLVWRWSNWCASRRAVQDVFFGPNGAVIANGLSAMPLPSCVDRSQPSRLVLVRSK